MMKHITDLQYCRYLTKKYGEAPALEIYAAFPCKDGTAPELFADYAQTYGLGEANILPAKKRITAVA